MLVPTVSPQQMKEAMPKFTARAGRQVALPPEHQLPKEIRIRCAIADFILNAKEGTLENRLYSFVAGMPIEIEEKDNANGSGSMQHKP
jgi:hypothetical protein